MAGSRRRTRLNAKLYAMVLADMECGPATRIELCEHSGLSDKTIQHIVRALHQRRLIHIAGWDQDALGRFTMPAFKFGRGKDMPKPAPKTVAELRRGYVARKRQAAVLHASAGSPALTPGA